MPESFSRKTLEEMWKGVESTDDRLEILFRISLDTGCRVRKLETRKRLDTAISSITGIVGGALAYASAYVSTIVIRGKP